MKTKIDISLAEEIIGYSFKDKKLLVECFTHSSFSNEHKGYKNNERLEFFGDAILGFIVTEYLFENNSKIDEGKLTEKKQKIVSKKPLSYAITKLGLEKFLILGEGEKNSKIKSQNLSENLFEALVAGIYIDGGLECAKKFVYDKLLSCEDCIDDRTDFKGAFQEYVQKNHLGEISYEQVKVEGPAHNPEFTMCVKLSGKILATEKGSSKQKAEQKCAEIALKLLKN